jgi:putative endonuclease
MNNLGRSYEERASVWLKNRGLRILDRNFASRTGEIDIIAWHDEHLAFIEVRARNHIGYAGAAASVSRAKQRKIIQTAHIYLQENQHLSQSPCRFDVIAFEPRQSGAGIRWIRCAFTA